MNPLFYSTSFLSGSSKKSKVPRRNKLRTTRKISIDPFENISLSMSYYNTSPNKSVRLPSLTTRERMLFRHMKYINRINNFNPNEECNAKISIEDPKIYKDPINSLEAIRSNQTIYNTVNDQLTETQMNRYNEKIKEYNGNTMKFKIKMPKIRISNIFPSSNVDYSKAFLTRKESSTISLTPLEKKKKLYCYYRYPVRSFPEGRENFSLTKYGNDFYLFGGIGSIISSTNNFWKLDLNTLEWEKIANGIPESVVTPQNRYDHTTIIYQGIAYIIGGRTKYVNSSIFSDFDFFDITNKKFIEKTYIARDRWQFRYGHISVLINNQVLVHGGVDENQNVLSNSFVLSLSPLKMHTPRLHPDYPAPALYDHCAALAIPKDTLINPRMNMYNTPEVQFGKKINLKLKDKGWYVFGGINENREYCDTLYLVTVGTRIIKWMKVNTNGKGPSPRSEATMEFSEKENALIIFGGRNDKISSSFALNDLYFIDLYTYEWIHVELYNEDPKFKVIRRCGHQSLISEEENKVIIFGGMNSSNYVGSSLFIINLDWSYTLPKDKFKVTPLQCIKEIDAIKEVELPFIK